MAHLVAPGGGTLRVISGPTGAVSGAIDVAPIAAAADHHLSAAAGTDEQPRRDGIVLVSPTGRAVDDGRGKSCDIAPACVPRHGVVHGAEAEPASWARRRACHLSCGPNTVGASRLSPPRPLSTDAHERSDAAPAADHPRTSCKVETSPDLRGFPNAIDISSCRTALRREWSRRQAANGRCIPLPLPIRAHRLHRCGQSYCAFRWIVNTDSVRS